MPDITPTMYISVSIIIFSLILSFVLNKTIKANPEFVKSPAIHVPILITPLKYSSVIKTLGAQFGISPIKHDRNGAKIEFVIKILVKISSLK